MDRTSAKYWDNKAILAIDYGKKFTGLALFRVNSDPFPLAYGRLAYKDDEQLIKDLLKIIDEEFVEHIVLGVPYFTDGSASQMTKTVLAFREILIKNTKIPCDIQDETLTTEEAKNRMKNSARYGFEVDMKEIDALSAVIILEDFLRSSQIS